MSAEPGHYKVRAQAIREVGEVGTYAIEVPARQPDATTDDDAPRIKQELKIGA